MHTLLVVGMLACPWLTSTVGAQAPVGSEFQINTYTTDFQRRPALAVSNGDFVVTWMSYDQDGHLWGVFGQLHDSNGSAVGTEFQVNSYTTFDQKYPDVAADADGDFVVVWQGDKQDGYEYGVFGRRFASDGSALGAEFQVNAYTSGYQTRPAVGAAANGDFVVVWGSSFGSGGQDGDDYGIIGQRFASNGSALGTEFVVNTYTTYNQLLPAVAASSNGDFVVVWTGYDGGGFGGVFGQRYASSGSAVGTEFQVNTYTTYQQLGPDVAADAAGNFVVVWGSEYQDGDQYGVFGQRYASSGSAVGAEFQVNTYTTYFQSYFLNPDNPPRVAMDAAGDFVVVWSSYYQDGNGTGVFGQLFSSSGSALGPEIQVNTHTTDEQGFPAVGADANGNFVVAWSSTYQPGDDNYGIFGQRFDKSPAPATATPTITSTPTITPTPTITSTPTTTPTPTSTGAPAPACAAAPLGGCDAAGKSILLITDKDENGAGPSDKLIWKWLKGPVTVQSDFGDPTSTAAYDFCLYNGASQTLVMEANLPAAGTCAGAPCWKPLSTKGYKRKDKAASIDGITQILLKGGAAGSAKIIVKGKEGNLDLDATTLPLDGTTDVIVQLSHSDNANCWQATFPSAAATKNTASQFKAKTP